MNIFVYRFTRSIDVFDALDTSRVTKSKGPKEIYKQIASAD